MLIDAMFSYQVLTFINGYSRYNQILVAKNNVHKIAFRCLATLRVYQWIVMPFGLKNTTTTYQRVMNSIFLNLISKSMKVHINDIVVNLWDIN